MDIDLTDKEIQSINEVKAILKDVLYANNGTSIDELINIFREVVTDCYRDCDLEIGDISLTNVNTINVIIFIKHKKIEFKISLRNDEESVHEQAVRALVEKCEPWRLTNPELVESERKIKEWANNYDHGK